MPDLIPVEQITDRIFLIRGTKVMLDKDLAELYEVEVRILKQAVRRNMDRFPSDFMFELNDEESRFLRSQSVILKRGEHSKYRFFAFTEQGVAMLSSVLRSKRAIQVNIQIMRAFTRLREMLATHDDLRRKIEEMEKKYDENFAIVFEAIKELLKQEDEPRKKIGFTAREKQAKYATKPRKRK